MMGLLSSITMMFNIDEVGKDSGAETGVS